MTLSAKEIQEIIPHRWPFLLVDRILELEAGTRAVGLKQVTASEWFFQGHVPGYPIMPGVLIVEALAQVGCVAILSLPQNKGRLVFFAGIEGFRFRSPVVPGDSLRLELTLTKMRGVVGKGTARAMVEDKVVAEGELTFALTSADTPQEKSE
jgi:3-hydroxyacyl-[acyl-carrier-protein] dehydratase